MANIRAYKLAEELGIDRVEFVEKAAAIGVDLKSAMAAIDEDVAQELRQKLGSAKKDKGAVTESSRNARQGRRSGDSPSQEGGSRSPRCSSPPSRWPPSVEAEPPSAAEPESIPEPEPAAGARNTLTAAAEQPPTAAGALPPQPPRSEPQAPAPAAASAAGSWPDKSRQAAQARARSREPARAGAAGATGHRAARPPAAT